MTRVKLYRTLHIKLLSRKSKAAAATMAASALVLLRNSQLVMRQYLAGQLSNRD